MLIPAFTCKEWFLAVTWIFCFCLPSLFFYWEKPNFKCFIHLLWVSFNFKFELEAISSHLVPLCLSSSGACSMSTHRLCNCGKGVHRLPLPLPRRAAGGGAAGGAVRQSPAEQQAQRPAWWDISLSLEVPKSWGINLIILDAMVGFL